VTHVDSTPYHNGVKASKIVDGLDILDLRQNSPLLELFSNELRDALRGSVLTCVGYDSFHDLSLPY
jgi:hypothetical protein